MRRAFRASLAFVLVASLVTGLPAEEEERPLWRDVERLTPLFEQALDAVEAHRGVPFETRPTLRVSTQDEVHEILLRELRPQLEATGQGEALETSAALTARALIAKYEFDTHVIHLLAERFEDEDIPLLGGREPTPDFFRVLFAHEAAHAHDIPRYGWAEKLGTVETADALKALDAVMEGHAQFVAKRVASAWEIPEAFETFTRAILEMPEIENEILRMVLEVLHAELTFSYVQGHAFLEAIHAAKGDEGVEAMLRQPPGSTRWIEHPELALDPDASEPSVDLVRALDAFAALAGDPRWSTTKNRVKDATLEVLRPQVPEAMRADFLDGLVDGHVLVGQIPLEQRQIVIMLLAFEEPSQALRFLEIERAVQEARDVADLPDGMSILEATYEEGAGPEDGLAGFRAHKRISIGPLELGVASHSFATERFFGQVLRVNVPEVTREHEVKAIARLLHYLENPEGAERTRAFDVIPIPLGNRTIEIRVHVVDHEDEPVPSASMTWVAIEKERWDDAFGGTVGTQDARVTDGVATLRVPEGTVRLRFLVTEARGASGEPLDLAPHLEDGIDVGGGVREAHVRLEPGATIRGLLVDTEGTGLPDLRVWARPAPEEDLPYDPLRVVPHASAHTGEDGTFTLHGLDPSMSYDVMVVDAPDHVPADPVRASAGTGDVRIELEPGRALRIRVLDPAGDAVAGAKLELDVVRGTWQTLSFRTKRDGSVELPTPHPDARYELEIRPPEDREDLARRFDVDWKPKPGSVVLEAGFTVRGRVTDAEGRPLAGCRVETRGRELKVRDSHWVHDHRRAFTRSDGRYVIRHLPRGPVYLAVRGSRDEDDVLRFQRELPDDAWSTATPEAPQMDLVWSRPPQVEIRVLGPDGKSVPRARVSLRQQRHTVTGTAEDGRIRIELLDAGQPFAVFVEKAWNEDQEVLAYSPAMVVRAPGTERVEIRLSAGTKIAGRVIDADGRGIEGALVSASQPGADASPGGVSIAPIGEPGREIRTDAEGRFEVPGLAPGRHVVVVSHPDFSGRRLEGVEAGRVDLVVTLDDAER